ncbi:aldehyde dehydrogenase [Fusarium mundagurra]|uniref:Putative aldehyde dehydrogenase FUS7 n=1 Tax=Fusarium mundagurra TaxID=1567541 RepID=A0A8H5XZ99_9HYPO|nr:aldehyde dehydrogenase [Fusarium mundagurra]
MSGFKVPKVDTSRFPFPIQSFIGGKFVDSPGNEKHTLKSSVNDAVLTTELQWSNAKDVDIAVESSRDGLRLWQAMTDSQKRDALIKYSQLIRDNREQLHWLEAVLVGKDTGFCNFEIDAAADLFVYYANMIDKFQTDVVSTKVDTLQYTLRQPWGICAGICPFNGVIITLAMKAAPALACGNSIIIKTSELNPFSTLFMASLAIQAGIPPGALNCLVGGAEVGVALSSHMEIRKISFTGSIKVGKLIQVAAAQSNLKSVTLELGGKSPMIVFPDADLERALQTATMFLLMNGQGCALPTRLYVHDSIANEFIAKLKAIVEEHGRHLGGDPTLPDTRSSPLYHQRQKEVVLSYIEAGMKEATLLTGGQPIGDKGCYIEPTIFVNPHPDAKILREEIFGPVLTVVRFSTDDEVVQLANDTEFGLAAYVWTDDMSRALTLSQKLEAGTVSVNGAGGLQPSVPTGGWKRKIPQLSNLTLSTNQYSFLESGQGTENGKEAMLDWTQLKSVAIKG